MHQDSLTPAVSLWRTQLLVLHASQDREALELSVGSQAHDSLGIRVS